MSHFFGAKTNLLDLKELKLIKNQAVIDVTFNCDIIEKIVVYGSEEEDGSKEFLSEEIKDVVFIDVDFAGETFFSHKKLSRCKFIRCNFNEITIKNCIFHGCFFFSCHLGGIECSKTIFKKTIMERCNIGAKREEGFYICDLTGLRLIQCTCDYKTKDFYRKINKFHDYGNGKIFSGLVSNDYETFDERDINSTEFFYGGEEDEDGIINPDPPQSQVPIWVQMCSFSMVSFSGFLSLGNFVYFDFCNVEGNAVRECYMGEDNGPWIGCA